MNDSGINVPTVPITVSIDNKSIIYLCVGLTLVFVLCVLILKIFNK